MIAFSINITVIAMFTIHTGNKLVASAEATSGVSGIGRVKYKKQSWV